MTTCPYCAKDGAGDVPVKILKWTAVGVAFKCPKHGVCGLRHDSMTEAEATRLGVDRAMWTAGGAGCRL